MSCVVGVVERGGVCIGADSAFTANTVSLATPGTGKIFRVGPFVVGTAGSGLSAQVIRYLDLPDFEGDAAAYLACVFAPTAKDALKDAELWDSSSREASGFGGTLIVAHDTRLFHVFEDMCVVEDQRGFAAAGNGGEVALGVLWATQGRPAEERVRMALEAASEICNAVRPPFVIEWTGRPLHAVA